MTRLTDSGSRRSWSPVEPMRSANTIVTTLRASVFSAGRGASDAPHASQNFRPAGLVVPQPPQTADFTSGAAHSLQKRAPSRLSAPQAEQVMGGASSSHAYSARTGSRTYAFLRDPNGCRDTRDISLWWSSPTPPD